MNTRKIGELLFGLASFGCTSYGAALMGRDIYTDYLLQNQKEWYTSLYNQYIDDHAGQGIYTRCVANPTLESRLECESTNEGHSLVNKAKAHALNISENLPLYVAAGGMALGGLGLFMCKKHPPTHEQIEQRLLPHRQLHQRLLATKLKEDAPAEFYDPLYWVLMDDPVKTSSNNGARRDTYNAQTLHSLEECPFTRTPLVVIGPDHDLKQRIQAHVESKEQIAEKIKADAALAEKKKQPVTHVAEEKIRRRRR